MGVVVKHEDDMPLTTQIQKSSNVSCKNFHTTGIVETAALMLAAQNFLDVPVELIMNINHDSLKPGWEIQLPERVSERTGQLTEGTLRKAKLLKSKGFIIEPGETVYLPAYVSIANSVKKGETLDLHVNGTLLPLVAGVRIPVGNGFTYRLVNE